MRINAGKWKGRPIASVSGMATRPTPDVVKQAIFNIIRDEVEGSYFCDFFAGTGNIAFEALSRGAKSAVAVENSREALAVIKKNAEYLGCGNELNVLPVDVATAAKRLSGKAFDIIFFDPPYNKGFEKTTLELILQNKLIKDTGVVIVQYEGKNSIIGDVPEAFDISDERRYGRTGLLFLKLKQV